MSVGTLKRDEIIPISLILPDTPTGTPTYRILNAEHVVIVGVTSLSGSGKLWYKDDQTVANDADIGSYIIEFSYVIDGETGYAEDTYETTLYELDDLAVLLGGSGGSGGVGTWSISGTKIPITINQVIEDVGSILGINNLTQRDKTKLLSSLNDLLDNWSLNESALPPSSILSITMVPGQAEYSLGTTTPATIRPDYIVETGYLETSSGGRTIVKSITEEEYDSIGVPTTSGTPLFYFFNPITSGAEGTSVLTVYPVPSTADILKLRVKNPLTGAVEGGALYLPPGYLVPLKYNLAVLSASKFGVIADPDVRELASRSLLELKRKNKKPITATYDFGVPGVKTTAFPTGG